VWRLVAELKAKLETEGVLGTWVKFSGEPNVEVRRVGAPFPLFPFSHLSFPLFFPFFQ